MNQVLGVASQPVDPLDQFINIEICLIYLQFLFALFVDPFRHAHS